MKNNGRGVYGGAFPDGAGCGQLPQGILASSGLGEEGVRLLFSRSIFLRYFVERALIIGLYHSGLRAWQG